MKLGVFDHMDRGLSPLSQFYEERLNLVEAYDRAGFHGYHVAEHHATPLGVAPSPGVWLAAGAQRTQRLSVGRFMLGVGRGISPIELRYYGIDPEQAPAMYSEALEVILRGMTGPVLNF